ncbi:unnamed protein product [Effrenium voratum]|uniref:Uncharacterized protein n=1 Tax=Effrenium voratum TaxID=2562239 RepID=A0AA36MUL9_9DINO|nr:unnamed protein product [Effrenium voratum]
MEEFARACAEALLGAGAAEERAASEAQAIVRCQTEAGRRQAQALEEKELRILALSEENAAQAFSVVQHEEEASRLRQWSYAYEATAKAEALTAQRCRSEMVTAVQELQRFHRMQQLQHDMRIQVPSRLEPILEGGSPASTEDADRELEANAGAVSLASTEADDSDQEDMKALVLRLQSELMEVEAERAKASAQRDEAREALAALQKEHTALAESRQFAAPSAPLAVPSAPLAVPGAPASALGALSGTLSPASPFRDGAGSTSSVPCSPLRRAAQAPTDPAGRLLQAKLQLNEAMAELRSLRSPG